MTVFDILREPLVIHEVGDADYRADMAKELMRLVGLDPRFLNRYPHSFSGGQRQRIGIARALALKPDLVLCDEPVSALDVSIQAQILNLLKDLQAELGLTYLFISHNLAVVHHIADRVGVMYLGRIVELATTRQLFGNPQHPYTRMLLAAVPDLAMTGTSRTAVAGEVPNPLDPPHGCAFHPRCPYANERCRTERPELLPAPEAGLVACHAVEEGRIDRAVARVAAAGADVAHRTQETRADRL